MRTAAIAVAFVVIAVAGVLVGAWWAPFTLGLLMGILEPRARYALPLGAVIGVGSWLAPLVADQLRYGIGAAAQSLAEIMGFGARGVLPLTLTLVVGLLLGLCGAWLGSAGRRLIAPVAR